MSRFYFCISFFFLVIRWTLSQYTIQRFLLWNVKNRIKNSTAVAWCMVQSSELSCQISHSFALKADTKWPRKSMSLFRFNNLNKLKWNKITIVRCLSLRSFCTSFHNHSHSKLPRNCLWDQCNSFYVIFRAHLSLYPTFWLPGCSAMVPYRTCTYFFLYLRQGQR